MNVPFYQFPKMKMDGTHHSPRFPVSAASPPVSSLATKSPHLSPVPALRSQEEAARIEAICAVCKWNIDWICEHPGCRPCRQRLAGGLKQMIGKPFFRCAAGLWLK